MALTKRQMYKRMRKILRHVESGGDPDIKTSLDSDLWGECVRRGFLNASPDSGPDESGIWHIILLNHNITPAGIEWLHAPNTILKSNISLAVSVVALLVSILANLQKIIFGLVEIGKLFGFAE